MSHTNRVALVTGASRGLGAVIARVLADRGYRLVLGARQARPLREVAAALRARGALVIAVDGDIATPGVRARLLDEAQGLGGLDVLVNNASELGGVVPLANLDPARLDRLFRVNVTAPVALATRALPLLAARGGLIVNITSDAAQGASPGWGAYGATKAALELITRTMAGELREWDVSAVSVDPGDLRTRMHQEAFPGQDISDRPLPEVTAPFWAWLFDQAPATTNGERFAAQQEDARWLQHA